MYSSVPNQIFQFSRYLLAFFILFMAIPPLFFVKGKGRLLDRLFGNFLKMNLLVIAVGYILVIIKLYEVIGIILALCLLFFVKSVYRLSFSGISERVSGASAYIYDCVDKNADFRKDFAAFFKRKFKSLGTAVRTAEPYKLLAFAVLFFIILVSCYLRFYDAFTSPQPNMSDGTVTLSWIKDIDARQLFIDGIYPQGFSIYMATLEKFSRIDTIYVLKYSGPFNELLILAGLYFVVSRLCGRKLPGIASVALYGLLYNLLPGAFERQAATNSQEFAMVFVLPTLYFYFRYFLSGDRDDLFIGFCGLAVTGLVHEIPLAFEAIGLVALGAGFIVFRFRSTLRRLLWSVVSAAGAVFIAASPAIIGHYILGMPYYASSESYAKSVTPFPLRAFTNLEYAVIIFVAVLLISFVPLFVRRSEAAMPVLFMALLLAASFVFYVAGGAVTGMEVIEDRSGEFYSLMVPVGVGAVIYVLLLPLSQLAVRGIIELCVCFGLAGYAVGFVRPAPIVPYKMISPDSVEQYLEISREYLPTEWLIVSYDETYDFVRGKGFQLLTSDFVSDYSPDNEFLKDKKTGKYYAEPNVFLYYEKNLYFDKVESQTYTLAKRRLYNKELLAWIDEHDKKFSNIKLYYEDKNFAVYKLDQSKLSVDASEKE